MQSKAQRLPGDNQVPVLFHLMWNGEKIEVMGYTYEHLMEHFLDENTHDMKRLMLCITAFNNWTGEVIKNRYGAIHKDMKV